MQTYLTLLEVLTKQNLIAPHKNSAMKVYSQNVVHHQRAFLNERKWLIKRDTLVTVITSFDKDGKSVFYTHTCKIL